MEILHKENPVLALHWPCKELQWGVPWFFPFYLGAGNLFVTLSGDALEAQSMMGGYYGQYGKTSYWLSRDRLNAIWYDEGWNIGYQAANGELEK